METITVVLKERSYPIIIASGLFNKITSFLPLKPGDQAMLITNKTVALLYLDRICFLLEQADIRFDRVILPDGEKYKNLKILDMVFTELLKKSHNRDTTLLALGGGVIGDLAGFAAAVYQRGVRLIQIPTTLLSQVDSAIGGKTAVNHPLGKNMIGSFYQPASVLIELECLKTLPARELSSGLAEVIKYGIILDNNFFCWLEKNVESLLALNTHALTYCIRRCCELKAKLVESDEHEIGLRALLNLGHTFCHAIEVEVGYGNWLHGEAVAAGIVMASRVSEYLGLFNSEETERIIILLKRAGLPVTGPSEVSAEKYLFHMKRDKKTIAGNIRLVLPIRIGKSEVYAGIPQNIVLNAISNCKG